jgi:pimeloyl-ACP methyl ester carboxylesterase
MQNARSRDGCRIHWTEQGRGPAILLIHGFASTLERNWQGTGWMQALSRAGWRAIAYDQRGHGDSEKRYAAEDYAPERFVEDALAVLEAAATARAVVMGYSMGARVALEVALTNPARARALILGGIGDHFRDFGGMRGDREIVAAALEADDPSGFPPGARFYRTFADQTSQDRRALAACWRRPIREIGPAELAALAMPTLVVAGREDTTAGDPGPLARAIPGAELVLLDRKNHINAVGAREHRAAVLRFLAGLGGEESD